MRVGFGIYHPMLTVSGLMNAIQQYLGLDVDERIEKAFKELESDFIVLHWPHNQLEQLLETCRRWCGKELVVRLMGEVEPSFMKKLSEIALTVAPSQILRLSPEVYLDRKQEVYYIEVLSSIDIEQLKRVLAIPAERIILDLRGLHQNWRGREGRFMLPVLEAAVGGYFLYDEVDVVFYHPLAHASIRLLKEGKTAGRNLSDYAKLIAEARE